MKWDHEKKKSKGHGKYTNYMKLYRIKRRKKNIRREFINMNQQKEKKMQLGKRL